VGAGVTLSWAFIHGVSNGLQQGHSWVWM
jgi:hypothetical protein